MSEIEEKERAKRIAQEVMRKNDGNFAKKAIKSTKLTLFILGGLFFIWAVVYGVVLADDLISLIFYGVMGVIYILLAFWTESKPFAAILTALIIYGTLILLFALIDPMTLFRGIILKAAIIASLIRGIMQARKIPQEFKVDTLDSELMQ
ncbi:hypothetical protein [Fulvivirga ligni]|uniref:hypothetical protein n=1 Tax=Fulvivirga ligni TaxID=2904246 RepID=UPI001F1A68D4|nr:hypothetical protein [Fulvivirga ligni]UII21318.1 hypothetical protein LVD16_26150 [Fulvivirga ligni]